MLGPCGAEMPDFSLTDKPLPESLTLIKDITAGAAEIKAGPKGKERPV
ncbi:hypothetical protein SAMN04488135_10589 [Pollutimonas bauzanensis]|uniref:Uncharacterized protein n=1 Tax=Pollutimonas bauzanensis TaxID=658167 RepID=A0A1M5W4P2_9BURK|nr:hypothetical protein SAMN04488135_10589 [Pollutimonas bauzanensis]